MNRFCNRCRLHRLMMTIDPMMISMISTAGNPSIVTGRRNRSTNKSSATSSDAFSVFPISKMLPFRRVDFFGLRLAPLRRQSWQRLTSFAIVWESIGIATCIDGIHCNGEVDSLCACILLLLLHHRYQLSRSHWLLVPPLLCCSYYITGHIQDTSLIRGTTDVATVVSRFREGQNSIRHPSRPML